MVEIHQNRVNEAKISTVLSEDVNFTGKCKFTRDLIIKGKYSGEIDAIGSLYISRDARVEADIKAKAVIISGYVKGRVEASEKVELLGEAVVIGDITAPKIEMGTGCRFDGSSRMESSE